jgi:hypothetical protein
VGIQDDDPSVLSLLAITVSKLGTAAYRRMEVTLGFRFTFIRRHAAPLSLLTVAALGLVSCPRNSRHFVRRPPDRRPILIAIKYLLFR